MLKYFENHKFREIKKGTQKFWKYKNKQKAYNWKKYLILQYKDIVSQPAPKTFRESKQR